MVSVGGVSPAPGMDGSSVGNLAGLVQAPAGGLGAPRLAPPCMLHRRLRLARAAAHVDDRRRSLRQAGGDRSYLGTLPCRKIFPAGPSWQLPGLLLYATRTMSMMERPRKGPYHA